MKKIYVTLLSGLCLLLLPNCGNNNGSSTPGPGSPTMSAQCAYTGASVPGQACSFPYANYQGFSSYYGGASSFGYTGSSSGGCGASPTTGQQMYPAYSASKGLGCVDLTLFTQGMSTGVPVQYAQQGAIFVPVAQGQGAVLRACDGVDQCASPNRCLGPQAASQYGTYGSTYGAPAYGATGLGICFQ